MTLNSQTGAVGAYLPSLLSMLPNLWSKTSDKQSEKSETIDSSSLNGRKVSQQLPAETNAVTTLAKTFSLSPENQTIIDKLAQKTYKKFERLGPLPEITAKEQAPGGISSYLPSAEKVGGAAGYTLGFMYGEAGLMAVASKVSAFMFGPGMLATFNANALTATAIGFGALPTIAAGATIVGAAALPRVQRGLGALYNKARGSLPEKPAAKKPENASENSLLSKLVTFKEGAYFIGSRELKTDTTIDTLVKRDTFYQICQQIKNSDQAKDLFKTYVRTRNDSKMVLADGHVCSKEEAELLTKAESLLRDDNIMEDGKEIAAAIELLAEHHKPTKDSELFSKRYTTVDEAYRKSIANDPLLVEMSDGTFGFENEQGVIHLISNKSAAAIRAGNEEYVNYVEQKNMDAFVKIESSEEPKTAPVAPESLLVGAFNRATSWLKA